MPTYVAFGKDFGVTVDAEPEEVAKKFSAVPPARAVSGDAAAIGIRLLPQRRGMSATSPRPARAPAPAPTNALGCHGAAQTLADADRSRQRPALTLEVGLGRLCASLLAGLVPTARENRPASKGTS